MPTPTSAEPGRDALPKTSTTQSSPQRSCSSSSSNPAIHRAAIERGDRSIAHRISTCPDVGSQPSKRGCSSVTVRPSANRCCPRLLPTGPDQLPDWMPETRSGGAWSSGHQTRVVDGDVEHETAVLEPVARERRRA